MKITFPGYLVVRDVGNDRIINSVACQMKMIPNGVQTVHIVAEIDDAYDVKVRVSSVYRLEYLNDDHEVVYRQSSMYCHAGQAIRVYPH